MLRNIIASMLMLFAYQPYQAPVVTDKNGQRRLASFADCQEAADELIAEFKNRKSR